MQRAKFFYGLALVCLSLGITVQAVARDKEKKEYHNPIIPVSVPDPTVIRADDGYFYLYGTENTHNLPI